MHFVKGLRILALFNKVRFPSYLPKYEVTTLFIAQVRLNSNKLVLPYSLVLLCSRAYKKGHKQIKITIPPILVGNKIKEIKIVP